MAATPEVQKRLDHRLAWTVITLTLFVFAAAIGMVTLHLRNIFQEQLIQQDGEVLHAATLLQQVDAGTEEALESEDPADRLDAILDVSTLREMVALRFFSREGEYIGSFPKGMQPGKLTPEDLELLRAAQPVSRFRPVVPLEEITPDEEFEGGTLPLIFAFVPMHVGDKFIGSVEFILDGSNVGKAISALERSLFRYALLIFAIGAGIASVALTFAFRHLHKANDLLLERTQHLVQANHELAMAAKTSAIGAVTAHLLHGLKNPLFGLQCFVSTRPGATGDTEQEWSDALQSTRRMQTMINDVVRILREEASSTDYELSCDEIIQLARAKLAHFAREREIDLKFENNSPQRLPNRHGNLVVLIVCNLVQNAIEALKTGGRVEVHCQEEGEELLFAVSDNGPGLPENLASSLFHPTISGKEGGTGLGLAISKQLANHLGADLTLAANSASGARFELRFKKVGFQDAPAAVLTEAAV